MEKVNINELAMELAEKCNISQRKARRLLKALVNTIQQGIVTDGLVKVKGLGTFKLVKVEARETVNVGTGKRVRIESHQKLAFTPEPKMKELVNRPFSMFETVFIN